MENDEIPMGKKNLVTVKEYIKKANRKDGNSTRSKSEMDELMYRHKLRMAANGIESWAATRYDDYNCSPDKTHQTINITSISNFSMIDTLETRKMVCGNDIDFEQIGNEPAVVFVEVCDSDRSMDFLVNLFYSQLMNALCDYADNYCENSRLPVPVQFILDDFATNARIDNFQNMIANIRSRGISAMIMVQSESQLKAGYREDAKTIVDNCNSYVYMGGMDTELTKDISIRADKPSKHILNMPIGYSWIFRRGQEPVYCRNFDIEAFMQVKGFEYGKPAKFSYDLLDEISSERRGA
jgi:type IV secretion system protein VirD4